MNETNDSFALELLDAKKSDTQKIICAAHHEEGCASKADVEHER